MPILRTAILRSVLTPFAFRGVSFEQALTRMYPRKLGRRFDHAFNET